MERLKEAGFYSSAKGHTLPIATFKACPIFGGETGLAAIERKKKSFVHFIIHLNCVKNAKGF